MDILRGRIQSFVNVLKAALARQIRCRMSAVAHISEPSSLHVLQGYWSLSKRPSELTSVPTIIHGHYGNQVDPDLWPIPFTPALIGWVVAKICLIWSSSRSTYFLWQSVKLSETICFTQSWLDIRSHQNMETQMVTLSFSRNEIWITIWKLGKR